MEGASPSFHVVPRSKVYAGAVDQILENIEARRFQPGVALPSERTLAAQLGVSRTSLREALRVLEHAGVLEARPGSGTYVTGEAGTRATSLRAKAAVVGDHSPLDLMVARAGLEPTCAQQAARARSEADLEVMRRNVAEHAALAEQGEDSVEVDSRFHTAVAAASHNPVLVALQESITTLMQEPTWRAMKNRSHRHRASEFLEHHRLILRAIEASDMRQAGQLMLMHITSIETSLVEELE